MCEINRNLTKECDCMKNKNLGFAFLLLGIIFAVSQEGVLLGIAGLAIVWGNSKEDGTPTE